MIANPTTLILGAGASVPQYPVGSKLRELIIAGEGTESFRRAFEHANFPGGRAKYGAYKALVRRFKDSHIGSIDAFLAEPENQALAEEGHIAIAAALLPCESKMEIPDWYSDLFNAIRFRDTTKRSHKLKVVSFNYDLSLEHFLFGAFVNAYDQTGQADARKMFRDAVEIIHVYGQLGELRELIDSPNAREYGATSVSVHDILEASKQIRVIGRHDSMRENFHQAFEAIRNATFVGIFGYGFDTLNNEILQLQNAVADKTPFATGYGLGSGARARLSSLAHQSRLVMGGKNETVKEFLDETDFLRWINENGAQPRTVAHSMMKVFEKGSLPYLR